MLLNMGNAPNELTSGAPTTQAFVSCVLNGFTVGGALENETNVAAPVRVIWDKGNILTYQSAVSCLVVSKGLFTTSA
jgi:hypothetical protein